MYIFYDPENLQIMGASTEKTALQYPYIEVESIPHTLDSLILVRKNKKIKIEFNKNITLADRIRRDQNYQIKF